MAKSCFDPREKATAFPHASAVGSGANHSIMVSAITICVICCFITLLVRRDLVDLTFKIEGVFYGCDFPTFGFWKNPSTNFTGHAGLNFIIL